MEKNSDLALIVINIDNKRRLNADVTEDYILVDIMYYNRAIAALGRCEQNEHRNPKSSVNTITGVKAALDEARINYIHITEGQVFYFTNRIVVVEPYQYNEG